MFFENQTKDNDQHGEEKHENRDPVDPIHILYPAIIWLVRISFFDIEIFCQFTEYSHSEIKDN